MSYFLVKYLALHKLWRFLIKLFLKFKIKNFKGHCAVLLLRFFALLPWRYAQNIGAFLGYLTYLLPTTTKKVSYLQLQECFPELSLNELHQLLRTSLINIGKTMAESICIWLWKPERSLKLIHNIYGEDELKAAFASNKAVVCLVMHLGNWELLSHYLGSVSENLSFYRPIKSPVVEKFIQRKRSQTKSYLVPSTRHGILAIIKQIKKGGTVGIPIDPEPSKDAGVFAPFLATTALTSKFAHTLLAKNNACGFFMHAVRLDDGFFDIHLEPVPKDMYSEDVVTSVTAMNDALGNYIKQYPSQYLWSMKRFKHRPHGKKRLY